MNFHITDCVFYHIIGFFSPDFQNRFIFMMNINRVSTIFNTFDNFFHLLKLVYIVYHAIIMYIMDIPSNHHKIINKRIKIS